MAGYQRPLTIASVATLLIASNAVGQKVQFEAAKLLISDGDVLDRAGTSADLWGDRIVVSASKPIAGFPNFAAYVFERSPAAGWSEVAKLISNDAAAGDYFAVRVSIWEDQIVAGAIGDDDLGSFAGAAYVFKRQPNSTWQQTAKLTASDGSPDDDFGIGVSIRADRLLVGARLADGMAIWSGAAYVFEQQPNQTWTEASKLIASDGATHDRFGWSVAISGDNAVVGAPSNAPAGAAYVFERQGNGTWAQTAKLTPSDGTTGAGFAIALDIDGDRIVVGAPSGNSTGTNAGSAYVFERQPNGAWTEVAKLVASDIDANPSFGYGVSVSADRIAIGAIGTRGQPSIGVGAGAAYIFERDTADTWQQIAKLRASDSEEEHALGWIVRVFQDQVLATAPHDDDLGNSAGAAYVFELPGTLHGFGEGCPGDADAPTLGVGGDPSLGGQLSVHIGGTSSGASIFLFLGGTPANVALGGGCSLLVQPAVGPFGPVVPQFTVDVPPVAPIGTVVMQAFVAAPSAPTGFLNTNGVEIQIH